VWFSVARPREWVGALLRGARRGRHRSSFLAVIRWGAVRRAMQGLP